MQTVSECADKGTCWRSVEGTPAGPVVYCSSHISVQERTSPAEATTTASGKAPGQPAFAQYANSAPGNYETALEEGRLRTMIEDRPASLIKISTYFDDERNRLRSLANSGNIMAKLIVETL